MNSARRPPLGAPLKERFPRRPSASDSPSRSANSANTVPERKPTSLNSERAARPPPRSVRSAGQAPRSRPRRPSAQGTSDESGAATAAASRAGGEKTAPSRITTRRPSASAPGAKKPAPSKPQTTPVVAASAEEPAPEGNGAEEAASGWSTWWSKVTGAGSEEPPEGTAKVADEKDTAAAANTADDAHVETDAVRGFFGRLFSKESENEDDESKEIDYEIKSYWLQKGMEPPVYSDRQPSQDELVRFEQRQDTQQQQQQQQQLQYRQQQRHGQQAAGAVATIPSRSHNSNPRPQGRAGLPARRNFPDGGNQTETRAPPAQPRDARSGRRPPISGMVATSVPA